MYNFFLKRFIDFIIACLALIILLPLLFVLSVWLYVNNRGSVFFCQRRPGKGGKPFVVVKFRTMNNKCDESGKLLPDKDRLTSAGRFIRSTSLDELPQLINILKGNMSFIGPRPLLEDYLNLYSEEEQRRHNVRPGLSGWAQVNGRNTISWKQKLEYDVWYVDNMSFGLDFKIFCMTIGKVFKREGINAEGYSTTTRFTGNN